MSYSAYLPVVALIVLPILGGILVALLPKGSPALAKQVALVVSLLVLAVGVVVALAFDPAAPGPFQLASSWSWIACV